MKQVEIEFMEKYLADLPYFLFFVVLGIIVNFLYTARSQEITRGRLAREFIGGIWISLIIFAVLEEFFSLSKLFIYVICSLAGFGNSRFLDFLQKDFFEFIILQGKTAVKNIVGRLKKNNNEDIYNSPKFSRRRMGQDMGMDEEESTTNEEDYDNRQR
jgi:F0F1-type ATP synthase assembly protein I